jgi:hypothetical protein
MFSPNENGLLPLADRLPSFSVKGRSRNDWLIATSIMIPTALDCLSAPDVICLCLGTRRESEFDE